jgi:DNA-binding transcriptional LysR family regulator
MELRQLRYFVAVGEEQHYGRAAQRLRVAQPALSRQIQNLEEEIDFELFERLPRGVKINAAGKLFLEDARRILQELNDATATAKRIGRGLAGTLKLGYVQSLSWHGIIPESLRHFRKQRPDAELQLKPLSSPEQIAAVQSGGLDAGFIYSMGKVARDLGQLQVGLVTLVLAIPAGHALTKRKKLRLKDLIDAPFILFPRRASPIFFDHLMAECARCGLKAPRVVQESADESIMLSMVACGIGVAIVSSASQWRHPPGITLSPVTDLNLQLPFVLIWRTDNSSPLLSNFIADVTSVVERQAGEGNPGPNFPKLSGTEFL